MSPVRLDVAGGHRAGALLAQHHALRAVALHLDGDVLDVEDDVGDVLAHARDRGEFVQHAVDLHRGDGRALQRRQQHAAQRVAERQAEAALERLGDERRHALRVIAGRDFELVRLDQFLPVLLDHDRILSMNAAIGGRWPPAGNAAAVTNVAQTDSDAAALARPAAIVRDRRHVADRGDGEARRLQRAQRRFTARTRTRNFDFERPHAVFRRLAGRILGRHLRGVRASTCASP